MNLAIVGVTGLVGRNFLKVLEERDIDIDNLYLFASERSKGIIIPFKGKEYEVIELKKEAFNDLNIDYALFSAGGEVSKEFAPYLASLGITVIDNSSAFRLDVDVPLVVPEVNPDDIKLHKGIIANPNCSTIQAAVAVAPLHKKYKIKRLVISTYQAVSGAGISGIKDLEEGLKGGENKKFPHPIVNNALPHIDSFLENGYTKEEMKLVYEMRKILGVLELKITATAVRVPVLNSHSESINIEFENPYDITSVKETLNESEGIILYDDPMSNKYPLAKIASGRDEVFVGRIRRDESRENSLNIWVVADNVRKGAATNAVQILEKLIEFNKEAL